MVRRSGDGAEHDAGFDELDSRPAADLRRGGRPRDDDRGRPPVERAQGTLQGLPDDDRAGPLVAGPTSALLLTATGRRIGYAELSGDGVAAAQARD